MNDKKLYLEIEENEKIINELREKILDEPPCKKDSGVDIRPAVLEQKTAPQRVPRMWWYWTVLLARKIKAERFFLREAVGFLFGLLIGLLILWAVVA